MKKVRPFFIAQRGFWGFWAGVGLTLVVPIALQAAPLQVSSDLSLPEDTVQTYDSVLVNAGATLTIGGGSELTVTGAFTVQTGGTVLIQAKNADDMVEGAWVGEGVTIQAGDLTVETGSTISADGQGYEEGKGPGSGTSYGVSHGGRGGEGTTTVYGSIYEPVDLGSACSAGVLHWSAGGGAIKLVVDGTLQLDGNLTANGMGSGAYTGGSGGSIWVDTDVLRGAGLISAEGGAGGVTERSSGGGRVAVYYRNGTEFTGFATASVAPGEASRAWGEPGTLVFIDKTVPNWSVRVPQRLELLQDTETSFGELILEDEAQLVLGGGAMLSVDGMLTVKGDSTLVAQGKNSSDMIEGAWVGEGVTIQAGDLTVETGSTISADGQGYAEGKGPGSGTSYGVSHGGRGGEGTRTVYGSIYEPVDLGSACSAGVLHWSAGGGAIKLVVDGTLQLDGNLTANGMGSGAYTGGSGGSIWIDTDVLSGAGLISAEGGAGGVTERSSGGGRVAVYYQDGTAFTGYAVASVSPGEASRASGEAGTLVFIDKTVEHWSVRVPQRLELLENSETTFGELILEDEAQLVLGGGASLEVDGMLRIKGDSTLLAQGKNRSDKVDDAWVGEGVTIRAGDLTIESGSTMTADGQGYVSNMGPGNTNAYGASHGGRGGEGTRTVYGSIYQPLDLGSACDVGALHWAAGGGAIKLVIDATLQLDGTISANGMGSTAYTGGSGGSIWIDTDVLRGAGLIKAEGGREGESERSSGGGRVAVYYRDGVEFTGYATASVSPGEATRASGEAGTLVFVDKTAQNWSVRVPQRLELLADTETAYGELILEDGAELVLGGGADLQVEGLFHIKGDSTLVTQAKNNTDKVDEAWIGEGVTIRAGDLTIETGSVITADGQGYPSGKGPGNHNAYGASHGGRGGEGADWVYGSFAEPLDLGSACDVGATHWAAGGGAIKLVIDATLQLDGTISANGMGSTAYTGGSGGSIWIDTDVLRGAGLIRAEGGREGESERSSGGGRVAVYYRDGAGFTGYATASVSPGEATRASGEAGTLVFVDKSVTDGGVRVSQRLELLEDSATTFGSLGVDDGAELVLDGGSHLHVRGFLTVSETSTITARGAARSDPVDGVWVGRGVSLRAGELVLEEGSAINADGWGYTSGKGPGTPPSGGASHGGLGGHPNPKAVYGSERDPVDLGSASNVGWNSWSAGGGAIKLMVDESLQLGGDISADGLGGDNYPGGSGGSIRLDVGSITGGGSISADGWASSSQGSAGGRIALYTRMEDTLSDEQVTVLGGMPIGEGTIYPGEDGTFIRRDIPEVILSEPLRTYLHGNESIFWKTYSINLGTAKADVTMSSDEQSFRLVEGAPLDEVLSWDTRPMGDGWYELRLTAREPDGSIPDDDTIQVCVLNHANWRSGTVTGNQVWAAGMVHVVDGTVTIESGSSLTIEAGAIVKFVPDASLYVEDGGTLDIESETEQNAILTSIADDSVGGDTNLDGSQSIPMSGSWRGIAAATGATIGIPATADLRYLVQDHSGALAESGEVWPGNQTHHVTSDVTVPAGATLRILKGAVIKFSMNTQLVVSDGGQLDVEGTMTHPVVFTSEADDSVGGDTNGDGDSTSAAAGDWIGLDLNGDSTLTYARILYSGGSVTGTWNGSAAITTGAHAEIALTNCLVQDALFDGILVGGADATILGSVFSRCDRGVAAFSGGDIMVVNTTIDDCRIGLFGHGGTVASINNIVSNSAGIGIGGGSTATMAVSYTNVWCPDEGAVHYGSIPDQTGSNGNISADPHFQDRLNGDFRLGYGSPVIDAADGSVAPPLDFFGMVRFDDPRTANTGAGTPADLGAYEFVEGAMSDLDLAVAAVEGPESVLAGSVETVRWTVRNLGAVPIRGPWRDRIALIPVAGGEESGLPVADVTVADGLTLGVGQSLAFSKAVVVPAGVEGRYTWSVTTNARGDVFEGQNRDNNHRRASTTTELSVAELEIGISEVGAFLSVAQPAVYKIRPLAGADIAISIDREGEGGWTRLVASEETMPTLAEAEIRSPQWNQADATLTITSATGGTYYVAAVPVHLPSSPIGFSLSASEMVFGIDAIGLDSGSNQGTVTLPILGTGLSSDTTASLIYGETIFEADETLLVDAMHLYATFDLRSLATGTYDVSLRKDGFTRELESAFSVTDSEPGELRTAVLLPEVVRAGREFTAWIEYENMGGTDLLMPLVGLSSPQDVTMRLNKYGSELPGLTVLALAPEGPPWILAPGQMGRVPVRVKAVTGRNKLRTHPITTDSTETMDWESLRDQIRPSHSAPDDWEAAWEMMVVDYGPTVGDYAEWASDAFQLRHARTGRVSHNPTPALRYYLKDAALALQARLEGTVQLEGTGQPLKSVSVTLYDEDGAFSDIAISESDGFLRFMEADAGSFEVEFDGYLPPENLQPVVLTAGTKGGPITWQLSKGAKLSGSVLLPASIDREGLVVSTSGPDGSVEVTGLDELGRYSFGGLLAGNHTVTFSGDGVVSEAVDGVMLTDGATTQGPVFSARAAGRMSGYVLQASDDQPIEGARVVASDGSGNGGASETAADGSFTIENLASGTYRMAAYAEGFAPSALADVVVVSGSLLTDIDLALEAGASVLGKVTAVALPVAGVFVEVTNGAGIKWSAISESDGSYEIADLPAGDWTLTVDADVLAGHEEVISLAVGEARTVNVSLEKLAKLSGVAHDGISRLSGVQAKLTGPDGTESVVFFDSDGRFEFGLEDPGEYVISLLDGSQRQVFTVVDATSEPEISFELETGCLEGTVVETDGETPLAGIEVVLIHAGQAILVARTNGDGVYRFPNVAAGTYSIEFADPDAFFAGIEDVMVEEGEATMLPTAIAGSYSLTVEVLSDGQPVGSGGLVALEKVGLDLGPATSRLDIFDIGESVGFTDLSLGEYRLHAITAGANSGYVTVTVEAGENSLQLPVHPSVGLSGTVRDEEGNGMAGILVSVYTPTQSDDVWQTYTEEDGHFQISTLLPGSYVVVIAPSIYTPEDDLLRPVVRSGVVLAEGATTRINAVMIQGGAGIGGTVSSDDGSIPLFGLVVLRNSDGVAFSRAEMASDGQYTLPEVPAGDYTLSATTSGFTVEEQDLAFSGTATSDYFLEATWAAGFLRPKSEDESEVSYGILWGEGLFNIGWLNRIKSALWEGLRTLLDAPPKKARNLPHVEWRDECDCEDAKAKLQEAYQWQKRAFDQWDNWNKQWEANQDILWSRIGELGVNLLQFAVSGIEVAKDAPAIVEGLTESREALWHSVDDILSEGNYDSDFFNESMEQLKQLDSLIHEFSNMFSLSIAKTAAGSAGSILDPNAGLRGTYGSISKYINEPGSLLSTKGGIWNMLNDINSFVGNLNTVAGLINDLGKIGGKFGKATGFLSKATAIIDMVTKGAEAIRSSMMAMEAEATSADLYDQLLEEREKAWDEAMRLRDECFEDCCDPNVNPECCDPEKDDCCPPGEECDDPPKDPDTPYGPGGTTNGIGSFDPNEKLTTGAGIGGFITPDSAIIYTINFENVSSATAAAQVVTVTDPLPDNLNWSTVELLSVGFNGEILVPPMTGLQTWSTRASVTSDPNPVEVLFEFDPDTGLMELVIQSVDAITGELPDDPFAGFLPPNDTTGRGEGFVSFLVKPVAGLTDGTQILNTAEIIFDVNDPIVTNEAVNTIDSMAPTALVIPLAERSGENFTVIWAGDDSGGAGVSHYDVYVSVDGGAWNPWLMGTEEISGRFEGERGSTYAFYVHATDSLGYANPVAPTAQAQTIAGVSFLVNISNRGGVGTGPNIMIPGFVLNGTGTKTVLVRAIGPTLGGFGVKGVLEDPQLSVVSGGTEIDANDNWGEASNAAELAAAAARVGAFPMDGTSADAATLLDLDPGSYTVKVSGVASGTGVALVEVYDADDTDDPTVKIVNISNRGIVGTGASVMIPGFVVGGESPKTVLIRGVGPKLADFGVQGVLENPILTVYSGADPVETNDDWSDGANATELAAAAATVGAFALEAGSQDAAVLTTLDPGTYTVKVSGVGDTTGVALVEIYEVPD